MTTSPSTRLRTPLAVLAVLCSAAAFVGCGADDPAPRADAPVPAVAVAPQDPSLLSPYGEPEPTLPASGGGAPGAVPSGVDGVGMSAADSADLSAESRAGAVPAPVAAGVAGAAKQAAPGGRQALRAGFVDDNADLAAYQDYLAGYRGERRDTDVASRQVVTVTDADRMPLLGARVTVGDVQVPTHVDGRALVFGAAPGTPVSVRYGAATATGTLEGDGTTTLVVDTTRVDPGDLTVDLDLVLDTTGSMGDEIAQLNTTLDEIATRLDALPAHPTVRYGLTVYRDQGDAYVVRAHDFTDLETFRAELATTTADGGGDTPEALDEAFHDSVRGPSWSQDTDAVQLVLLVSDASAHLDDQAAGTAYLADLQAARDRGIEVVPLAASGTDNPAEYQFRQLAQQTLGTFFFLTYGRDGGPGDETTTHVEDYATGSLDDLVVGHVSARLAAYDAPVAEPSDGPSADPTPTDATTQQVQQSTPR